MNPRLPNLDGLRAIAALLVLFSHAADLLGASGDAYVPRGWVKDCFFGQSFAAVQFFFVLSGFLITRLILLEMRRPAGFSLRTFWLRRIARIWPVYYLVILVSTLLAWTSGPLFSMSNNSWVLLLCFLENFDLIRLLKANLMQGIAVSVLWSVSIEEQFYLVYPIVLSSLKRPFQGLLLLSGVVVTGFLTYRQQLNLFHTLAACYQLGVGALLAWAVHPRNNAGFPRLVSLLPYVLLFTPLESASAGVVRPLLFAAIIYDQAFSPRAWLQTRTIPGLNGLGRLSYGLYAYHMILVLLIYRYVISQGLVPQGPLSFTAYLFVVLGSSLTVSWLSYRWIERPILDLAPR